MASCLNASSDRLMKRRNKIDGTGIYTCGAATVALATKLESGRQP